MQSRVSRAARVAALIMCWASLASGSALAASASSNLFRFFGPTQIGGLWQCAQDQATVDNTSKTAFGTVNARGASDCSGWNNRPSGNIGTQQYLLKGTSGSGGTICGFTDWTYNSGSASSISIGASW